MNLQVELSGILLGQFSSPPGMIEAPIVPQGSLSLLVPSFVYDYVLLYFLLLLMNVFIMIIAITILLLTIMIKGTYMYVYVYIYISTRIHICTSL